MQDCGSGGLGGCVDVKRVGVGGLRQRISRKKTWQSRAMSKVEGSGKAVVEVRCRFIVLRGFGS